MAKIHKYDMSRRLDNGKWQAVGKAYQDDQTGRITLWINPDHMKGIVRGQSEDIPFILFDKDPTPSVKPVAAPKEPARTAHFQAKPQKAPPVYTQPPELPKPSDSWPDFDDTIPF